MILYGKRNVHIRVHARMWTFSGVSRQRTASYIQERGGWQSIQRARLQPKYCSIVLWSKPSRKLQATYRKEGVGSLYKEPGCSQSTVVSFSGVSRQGTASYIQERGGWQSIQRARLQPKYCSIVLWSKPSRNCKLHTGKRGLAVYTKSPVAAKVL